MTIKHDYAQRPQRQKHTVKDAVQITIAIIMFIALVLADWVEVRTWLFG